jgi:hypothetical protein
MVSARGMGSNQERGESIEIQKDLYFGSCQFDF